MTEKEIVSIIRTLKAYYPYYYKGITAEEAKAVVEVWKTQFKDFDLELVKRAVDQWGGRYTTPPSIAEIKHSLFNFHTEYSQEYSRLLADKNADPHEVERIKRLKEQAWSCASTSRIRN